MSQADAEELIALSTAWFQGREDVLGLLLVGSHARGAARPDSDVDLVVLTRNPQAYRADRAWPDELPLGEAGLLVKGMRDQDYGVLWSRHVMLSSGTEIEYGFAPMAWTSTDPFDPGTLAVLSAGHRILYDPLGLLKTMSEAVASRRTDR
jgi:predicted nucleotidyltransferase